MTRQAQLVGISRSGLYYRPRPVAKADLDLMRRLDELHLERPFMGARMLRDQLDRTGIKVGRRRVGTLMKRMGIEALYQIKGASSQLESSFGRSMPADANSAWTAEDPGGTMFLWNDCGGRSNTKRSICMLMTQSTKPADRSCVIWIGTTASGSLTPH